MGHMEDESSFKSYSYIEYTHKILFTIYNKCLSIKILDICMRLVLKNITYHFIMFHG